MLGPLREWDAPAYVIAEAGVNHGGDVDVAREMVVAAAASGVDAIKFQTYKAGRLATRASEAYWDRTKETTSSQYELFARYDALDEPDYRALAE
jgi:sialic acid synthase SpsE